MCAEVGETEQGKVVHVTVALTPYVYSRLALLAHRHEQPLGDAIREALSAYVETHVGEDAA